MRTPTPQTGGHDDSDTEEEGEGGSGDDDCFGSEWETASASTDGLDDHGNSPAGAGVGAGAGGRSNGGTTARGVRADPARQRSAGATTGTATPRRRVRSPTSPCPAASEGSPSPARPPRAPGALTGSLDTPAVETAAAPAGVVVGKRGGGSGSDSIAAGSEEDEHVQAMHHGIHPDTTAPVASVVLRAMAIVAACVFTLAAVAVILHDAAVATGYQPDGTLWGTVAQCRDVTHATWGAFVAPITLALRTAGSAAASLAVGAACFLASTTQAQA